LSGEYVITPIIVCADMLARSQLILTHICLFGDLLRI